MKTKKTAAKAKGKLATVHKLTPKHLLTSTVMFTLAEFPNGEFECALSPLQVSAHYLGAGMIKARAGNGAAAAGAAMEQFLRMTGVRA